NTIFTNHKYSTKFFFMKRTTSCYFLAFIVFLITFNTSCEKIGDYIHHGHTKASTGYVYSMSNTVDKNSILVYRQDAGGRLAYKTSVTSGGAGKGMGLGSQGALILDKNKKWMYAVNAGDNTISS